MGNKFEVKKSDIEGTGLFATKPIQVGELICHMEGEEISILELKKRYETGEERLTDPLQIDEKVYLDLFEPYIYGNHSCDPNAALKGKNELIAIRDIKKDEEITYDYSLTEWSDENSWNGYDEWNMRCFCEKPQCRRIITEFNFLPETLQTGSISKGYVRDFIVKKFERIHERQDNKIQSKR